VERPNVLLIVLDAARRDAIEPYGAPRGATPAIADLARRGSALPRAYSAASWTLPSHASMFTGMLPRALGLGQAPGGTTEGARRVFEGLSDRLVTTHLRDCGYTTHGVSTNLWASGHVGLDIGFDRFEYFATQRQGRLNGLIGEGPRATLAWASEGLRSNADDGAASAGRALRDSIETWTGRPTFWFVNLVECHSPYLPPRPWNDLTAIERLRAGLDAKRHLNFFSICRYVGGNHDISKAALERMRHLYMRAVSYMDQWVADVLEALDNRGILEQTLVIVTSDHGENFGEGGLIAHGFSVDERLIHVPLVSAGPGTPDTGHAFSLTELPAVLADAAQLEDHPWRERALPARVAVAQYDPMATRSDSGMRAFAAKLGLDELGLERLSASFTCVTDGAYKLVLRNGEEFRYDLGSDPNETAPLEIRGRNGVFAELREALEHPAVTARAAQPSTPSSDGELASIERQMKLLGYM
jgi:arylsulfatase A-like enzyme